MTSNSREVSYEQDLRTVVLLPECIGTAMKNEEYKRAMSKAGIKHEIICRSCSRVILDKSELVFMCSSLDCSEVWHYQCYLYVI